MASYSFDCWLGVGYGISREPLIVMAMCTVEVNDVVAEMWSVVEYLARFPTVKPPNTIIIYLTSVEIPAKVWRAFRLVGESNIYKKI
jgi:hypothetical protein